MQTQIQKLQQQLKDLTLEHEQLKEKYDTQSASASISPPAARPSMLGGVKAMLQKLNGSQQQQRQLPVSVPSLVIGQHLGVDTPTHSAYTASSSTAAFKHDSKVILQQPQGHFNALEGTTLQPVTQNAEVAESTGQQEDDWDVLLRCASNQSWICTLLLYFRPPATCQDPAYASSCLCRTSELCHHSCLHGHSHGKTTVACTAAITKDIIEAALQHHQ